MIAVLATLILAAPADVRAEIASRYQKWDAAYLSQDAKTLASLLHPRFKIVTESGKIIPRKDYVKGLGKGNVPEEYRTDLLKTERTGRQALAWTKEFSRQPGEDRHIHLYRDTWLNSTGHWLLLESRTLAEEKEEGTGAWVACATCATLFRLSHQR